MVSNLIAFFALALSLYQEYRHRQESTPRFDLMDTSVYFISLRDQSYAIITSTVANRSACALPIEAVRLRANTTVSVRPLSPIEVAKLFRCIPVNRQTDRDAVSSALSFGIPTSVSAHAAQRIALAFRLDPHEPLEALLDLESTSANRRYKDESAPTPSPDSPPFLRLDIWVRGHIFHCFVAADIVTFVDRFDIAP